VKKNYYILIADRNPHVREFLKREMAAEGYQISTAASCAEVIRKAYSDNCLDVIILDPDLPGGLDSALLQTLRSRVPAVPVILHGLSQDLKNASQLSGHEIFVEKRANSIDHLKKIVQRISHPL
jgi:DNA-binding NtrC family response regulator